MEALPVPEADQGSLRDSFIALYDSEASTILAYLTAATSSRADAEDLASDTFLRAWKSWSQFRDMGTPPRFWLLKIARNLVTDRSRTSARLVPLEDHQASVPDVTAATAVARTELFRALALATDQDRHLLALRASGLSFAGVGEALGKSEAAAKMAWHRAARRLRQNLEVGDE